MNTKQLSLLTMLVVFVTQNTSPMLRRTRLLTAGAAHIGLSYLHHKQHEQQPHSTPPHSHQKPHFSTWQGCALTGACIGGAAMRHKQVESTSFCPGNAQLMQLIVNQNVSTFSDQMRDPSINVNQADSSGYTPLSLIIMSMLHFQSVPGNAYCNLLKELLLRGDLEVNTKNFQVNDEMVNGLTYCVLHNKPTIVMALLDNSSNASAFHQWELPSAVFNCIQDENFKRHIEKHISKKMVRLT